MIQSYYYQSYRGPPLVKSTLGTEDITEAMTELYGENCNWQGFLWIYKEAFGDKSYCKNFRFDFKSEGGIDH